MGKRLLASFLAAAMMLTMAPVAFAIENTEDTIDADQIPATEEAVAGENQIETKDISTLQSAIDAANGSYTLTEDTTADITINKNLVLDLGGHTLTNTNVGEATITVASGATVTVKKGSVRGGTGYYNIQVAAGGTLTLEGVTATAGNNDSSMIDNYGDLTINSGSYTGGLDTIKNESNAKLTITGGTFTLEKGNSDGFTGVVFNYGELNISGGEFIQSDTNAPYGQAQVIHTVKGNAATKTTITGGVFKNLCTGSTAWTIRTVGSDSSFTKVSGGMFNKSISDGYCADGFIPTKNADGTYGVKEGKYVAQIGDKKYETLADAIRLATKGKTVKLLNDVSEDISVPAIKEFKLDLNGHTLTNASGDTITVAAKANLTIQGEGTVDNVTHGKAAIVNNGTVTLNGGTYTRSKEAGKDGNTSGGNSYYTILNDKGGNMTINSGVTVTNTGHFSSMIRNGGEEKSVLTINGGTFSGGINTVKNAEYGVLTINDGNFSNTSQFVVMNWNDATINGGTFSVNKSAQAVLFSAEYDKSCAVGELTITGGTFKGTGNQTMIDTYYSAEYIGTASVSGGVFTADVTKFCAPGYKTELTNGVYVVKAGTNDAINAIDEAIKDGATEDKIKAAVDAVASTPNATLSNSSTTMDKLAKLEEVYKNANTGINAITVKVENGTADKKPDTELQAAKNAALSAVAGQAVTINVDKNTTDAENVTNAIKTATGSKETPNVEALDITMKIDGTEAQPKAPVVLTFELPNDKQNAQIYRIEGNTATKIPTTLNVNAEGKRTISGTFDHFSTYGIQYLNATANENKYTLILQPNTREVSAGDTLTYTVSLRHDAGSDNDTISGLRFNLDANEGLKLNPSASKGFDNTVTFGQTGDNGNYQFNFVGTKTLQTNQTMSVGTLSYTVQDYGNNGDKVTAPVANTTVVTNSGTNVLPSLSVDSGDVTYHEIELTFVQPAGVSSKYYAKYNATGLYETIADMINGTMAQAPTVTDPNSTEYRLIDTNWHAETDMDTIYDISNTKNIMSTTYVTNKQEIVKVTVSDGVTITSTPVTERSGEKYIDKGAELTFTVKDPDAGMKNKVTATIGNGTSAELTPAANGTYTVPGNKITGDVTITVRQELALTAADIKIFKKDSTNSGVQGYLPYSTYSGTRTLVLIKGAAGVNYTLGENQPEIFALPENAYKTDDGTASYTHAVLMKPTDVVSEEAMLTALKEAGLRTTADNVTLITYDWKTAGEEALDFQNVTTTYDFKSLTDDKFKWDPSDAQLLKADVLNLAGTTNVYQEDSYQTARDGHVSDEDVAAFMYLYAKLAKK